MALELLTETAALEAELRSTDVAPGSTVIMMMASLIIPMAAPMTRMLIPEPR
jgi:hypothetical protein